MVEVITLSLTHIDGDIARIAEKIARLQAEIKSAEMEANRLQEFRAMALRYGAKSESEIGHSESAVEAKRVPRAGSQAATIGDGCVNAFRAISATHIQTPDLLKFLHDTGVNISSDNKAGYLASVLSRDPRFVSERPYGWRLTEIVPGGSSDPAIDPPVRGGLLSDDLEEEP